MNMQKANLMLLQTFYLVAKYGSFSAAARHLNVSYQSAANHVRRLEGTVGDSLIQSERGQQIELTPRGRALYNLLFPEMDAVLERLTQVIEKQRPVLRIGLPQAYFYYLLPDALKMFHDQYPDVEIQAFERDTILAEMVRNGELDICINERFFGDTSIPQRVLGKFDLCLICPADWPPPPQTGDIARWAGDRPFITYEPGQTLRNMAVGYLESEGLEPNIMMSTSGSSSIMRCVESGIGYSIIPSWCISDRKELVYSRELETLSPVNVYFGRAQFLLGNPYVDAFYSLCVDTLVGHALHPAKDEIK